MHYHLKLWVSYQSALFLLLVLVLCGCCLGAGCFANEPNNLLRQEHPEWAVPLTLEGVPNLHKVSEDLYRGAQPTAEGMQALATLGVKTIINLRTTQSDRDELRDIDVHYEHIPMLAFAPGEEAVICFLRIVTNPERVPVFVHCQHGADRTGLVSAVYRIVMQDWTKEAAIQEMTEGGFGYHSIFRNLIWFLEGLDIEKIRGELGIESEKLPASQ